MNTASPMQIFIDACLINNFVLAMFLGICPFLGVSAKTAASRYNTALETLCSLLSEDLVG